MENELKISNSVIPCTEAVLGKVMPILDETPISPMAAMMAAINANVDLSKIEKMIELQQKWDAIEAKKAYTRAMAEFKKTPLDITKDGNVKFKNSKGETVDYNHATLGNVTGKINASLSNYGLSASWTTEQKDGTIIVTCNITHEKGHRESTSLFAAPDTSGSKNSIQAICSTITYLERYTILALTGLATHDQDDDAERAEVKYLTEEHRSKLVDAIADVGVDSVKFLKWLGYESFETIEEVDYNRAISGLKEKKAEKQKKEGAK
jgi:hypothetical protein